VRRNDYRPPGVPSPAACDVRRPREEPVQVDEVRRVDAQAPLQARCETEAERA
jgi:hypothetical protein